MSKRNRYARFDKLPNLRFKCPNCKHRGYTLIAQKDRSFECTNCHTTKPMGFWHSLFDNAPKQLTISQACKLIGANSTGSALRRARIEGRIKIAGRVGKREYLIDKMELVQYYVNSFGRKDRTRWEPKDEAGETENGKH